MSAPATRRRRQPKGAQRYAAIDGYRGFFIMLVLLYHSGVTALAGGWIGINHFFVFSGFLIARLLIREQHRTGTISAINFYIRRARRIVPAMVILVAAVLVHTAFFEEATQRKQFGGDSFATLGFFLNWRLISRDDAYFDMFGHPSPLRHAWTLSVEEQFYVLAPFLILLVCWFIRGRLGRATVPAALAALSAWWTAHIGLDGLSDYPRLYYGTDTRAQALLVGVAVAFILSAGSNGRPPRQLPRVTVELLGWVGLIVSVSALFLLDESTPWVFNKGGMLLFAVAAGIIGFSAIDTRPLLINQLFSWSPLVFLGRISYGLYLYHWPIHLWLKIDALPALLEGAIQLGVTIGVAALSFRYFELPILKDGLRGLFWRRTTRRAVPIVTAVGLVAASLLLWSTSAPAAPTNVPTLVAGQAPYEPTDQKVPVGLVGDSVASSMGQGWNGESFKDIQLNNQTRIGCDLLDAPVTRDGKVEKTDPACTEWQRAWPKSLAAEKDTSLVLLAGTHFLTAHQGPNGPALPQTPELAQIIRTSLDKVWSTAKASGVRRVSIVNLPCRRISAERLDPRLRFFATEGSNDQAVAWANQVVATWVKATPGAQLLDLHAQLCKDGYRPEVRGVNLYHDTLHFSPEAAAMIWTWITPQVREHSED